MHRLHTRTYQGEVGHSIHTCRHCLRVVLCGAFLGIDDFTNDE